jgi:hypothetical protein
MPFVFTPAESAFLSTIPKDDIEELLVELDVLLESTFDRDAALSRAITEILDWLPEHGLPVTRYDLEDLQSLPVEDLEALALRAGVPRPISPHKVVKYGAKPLRRLLRDRPRSALLLLLPSLIGPLARAARLTPNP